MFVSNEPKVRYLVNQIDKVISDLLIVPIAIECTDFEDTYGYPDDCKVEGLEDIQEVSKDDYDKFDAATGGRYAYAGCKGKYNGEEVIFAFDNIDSESINCGILSLSKLEEFDYDLFKELTTIKDSLYKLL